MTSTTHLKFNFLFSFFGLYTLNMDKKKNKNKGDWISGSRIKLTSLFSSLSPPSFSYLEVLFLPFVLLS